MRSRRRLVVLPENVVAGRKLTVPLDIKGVGQQGEVRRQFAKHLAVDHQRGNCVAAHVVKAHAHIRLQRVDVAGCLGVGIAVPGIPTDHLAHQPPKERPTI